MAVKIIQSFSRFCFVQQWNFLLLVLFLFGTLAISAQTPTPTAAPIEDNKVERVQTDLVTLTTTVTDLYGRYVSGLTKEAFTVFDNNEEQEITFFSDADAPVSLGILFDVSASMSGEKNPQSAKSSRKIY